MFILVCSIRRLAARQLAGEEVDDKEVAALEAKFNELKALPEPDPKSHIEKVQRFWKQNPREKKKYVERIEERRAYYKKFAVQKGEHRVSELREITSVRIALSTACLYATTGVPAPTRVNVDFTADFCT